MASDSTEQDPTGAQPATPPAVGRRARRTSASSRVVRPRNASNGSSDERSTRHSVDADHDSASEVQQDRTTPLVANASVANASVAEPASNRLVSEAVLAGFDAMATVGARVPVGAGGGGLPPRPDDLEETRPTVVTPAMPVVGPSDVDQELADAIAIREPSPHPLTSLSKVLNSFIGEAGEMTLMGGQVFKSAILHPRGYWGDVKDQIFDAMKLCWVPMLFAVTGFGFGAPGLQGGNILYLFGVPDRLGGFMMFASIREFAPFVEAMVVAGVVGTAITADLGARRIREEIDAMEVLGVDPIRKLILPRIISTIIMTAIFDLFALLVGIIGGYFAGVYFLGSSPSGFVASFYSQANISDDWGSFVKCAIFGLIIGLVCSYKGYRAKGGPAGVGRAVNQAVVVSFALIWVVDYTFTNLLLGYAPSTQVIK